MFVYLLMVYLTELSVVQTVGLKSGIMINHNK
jgi:hypothetical protein